MPPVDLKARIEARRVLNVMLLDLRECGSNRGEPCGIHEHPQWTCAFCLYNLLAYFERVIGEEPAADQEVAVLSTEPLEPGHPIPYITADVVRRQDVLVMWNRWRRQLPTDGPFRHSDGVQFMLDLNAIEAASPRVGAPTDKLGDDATEELLAALDELYPLPDDDRRVERAGRTAHVLKRWMAREHAELERIAMAMLRDHFKARVGAEPSPETQTRTHEEEIEARVDKGTLLAGTGSIASTDSDG